MIVLWIVLISVFMTQLLFYTRIRMQCIKIGYEIAYETEKHRELLAEQNDLQIELATLKSPERIADLGAQIGLVYPKPEQMVIINETR